VCRAFIPAPKGTGASAQSAKTLVELGKIIEKEI